MLRTNVGVDGEGEGVYIFKINFYACQSDILMHIKSNTTHIIKLNTRYIILRNILGGVGILD